MKINNFFLAKYDVVLEVACSGHWQKQTVKTCIKTKSRWQAKQKKSTENEQSSFAYKIIVYSSFYLFLIFP